MLGFLFFVLAVVGAWCFYGAFYEMRRLLRQINQTAQAQTELLKTHTRLLAAIANAADPVECVGGYSEQGITT
jgi:hypothetical protein